MNGQLKELYQKHWDSVRDNIVSNHGKFASFNYKDRPAFPYMLCASEKYINSKHRVMLCGQETYDGWYGKESKDYNEDIINKTTVDNLTKLYDSFVNQNCGYGKSFWGFYKQIYNSNPDVGFIANNIVKIGKRKGRGYDPDVEKEARSCFPVFKEEVNILKPDLIIFLTGPNYDDKIEYNLGSFSKENCLDKEEFSFLNNPANICFDKLNFNDNNIPLSYRINHPGAIQRQHQYYPMIKAIDIIIKDL